MKPADNKVPTTTKTPVAPKTPTRVSTPVAPTFRLPGMSIGPQFAGSLKTPIGPNLGVTTKTPLPTLSAVKDKASSEPTLFGLKGQSLGIVPPTYDPFSGKGKHAPAPQSLTGKAPDLFHGSNELIKAGEKIQAGGPKSKDYAYATSDLPTAAMYAANRTKLRPESTGQYSIFGTISGVRANNDRIYKDTTPWGENTAAYISKDYTSTGPTHLVDYTGKVTPIGSNKPVTARPSLKTPRAQGFEQGKLDFGNWTPRETIRG